MKEVIFQRKDCFRLVQLAKSDPYRSSRVNRRMKTQLSELPRDVFFPCPRRRLVLEKLMLEQSQGSCLVCIPLLSDSGDMGERFHDGNKFFLFIGVSIANNFIFIPVTPSKLPECSPELPQPVMQSGTRSMTCY